MHGLTHQSAHRLEIYIGSEIEHDSERIALEHIARTLPNDRGTALLLANINVAGRQIDLILAFNDLTIVLEAKAYARPVKGTTTGCWQIQLASGQPKNIDNAYLQALGAKNALRDAMRAFAGTDISYYPHAAVVFVPGIPGGSSVSSGDFKVAVISLSDLQDQLQKTQANCWSLDQWRAFAHHHNLLAVPSIESACNAALFRAQQCVAAYIAEYRRMYETAAARMIRYSCTSNGEKLTTEDIARRVAVEHRDTLLIGPSGCGKSLLASHIGISFADHGGVPILLVAQEYEGNLKALLNREIGLLSRHSASQLLAMARDLGLPTLVIVDGYNECPEARRVGLTRSVAALCRRFDTTVIATSQVVLARADLLALQEVYIPPTELRVKIEIASRALAGRSLSMPMEELLRSISSGLEASLIGEVGNDLSMGASRYGLFDAFVRKRLTTMAAVGIAALSDIAGWLSTRVASSLSIRDLDRLAQAAHVPSGVLSELCDKHLLRRHGDRVSFGHEQFFNAFTAEWVIRQAAGRSESVIAALRSPRHDAHRDLIVGAIDDDGLLISVLEQVDDASLIAACLDGTCGRIAKDWAQARIPQVLERMRREIQELRYVFIGDGWWNVQFDAEHYSEPSAPDSAFVSCLTDQIAEGRYVTEVFELAGALDQKMNEEAARLRKQLEPQRPNLKHSMFAISYALPQPHARAINILCSKLHVGPARHVNPQLAAKLRDIEARPLSSGQYYLLACLYRDVAANRASSELIEAAALFYERFIRNQWRSAPQHLRMTIIDGAGYCWYATEPALSNLAEAVESVLDNENPLFNGLVFDVLQRLRPFDEAEQRHETNVTAQMQRLLASDEEQQACNEAGSIYNCQFDHPYSNAYYAVIQALSHEQRKKFLRMALKGSHETSSFLVSLLVVDAAALNDASIGPILARWTTVPPRNSILPQEAIEAFVMVHIALGRLACPLPVALDSTHDVAADALLACGSLLYWSNRLDLPESRRHEECRTSWEVLHRHELGAAAYAIRDCGQLLMKPTSTWPGGRAEFSIAHYFPSETAAVCRHALEQPAIQVSYFPQFGNRDQSAVLRFALDTLGQHGNPADLSLLRRFVDDAALGKNAIKAIQAIEQRLQ